MQLSRPTLRSATFAVAVTATAFTACFALFQLGGRAIAWQLPHLEPVVNRLLAQRATVAGLEGRWQGLNPGLFVGQLTLPAGEIQGIDFELDLFESVRRLQLIARRLTVADGHLTVVKTADGWRLRGAGGGTLDVPGLLRFSDEVWARGQVRLEDGARADTVDLEAMVANRDRQHRFYFYLHSGSGCAECAITVTGDIEQEGSGTVRVVSDRFAVSQPLLSVLGITSSVDTSPWRNMHWQVDVDGEWVRDAAGGERARLATELRILGSTGAPGAIRTRLAAWREQTGYRGRVAELTVASNDSTGTASGAFAAEDVGSANWAATLWFPELQLGPMLAPWAQMMGANHPAGRWLAAVAPRGRMGDLTFHFDRDGFALQGRGSNGAMSGHKGVPEVDGLTFAMHGHQRALRLAIAGRDFNVAFPGHIRADGPYSRGGATMTFAFAPPYIGMRTDDAWLTTEEGRLTLALGVARPPVPAEVRIVADGRVDRSSIATAKGYLPAALDPALREWLLAATGAGHLVDNRVVYRGHARTRAGLPMRQLELAATLEEASLHYHDAWPPASRIDGALEVTRRETRLAGSARAFDIELDAVALRTRPGAARAAIEMRGAADFAQLFAFARQTPVRDGMPFMDDTWNGSGLVRFEADLNVPFDNALLQPGDIELNLDLEDASLDLADLGLHFEGIHKAATFEYPAMLTGASTDGELFGAPAQIAIASDGSAMRISVGGSATVADAYRLLGIEDLGIATGDFDFDAALTVFTASDRALELHIESDLAGLALALPSPLGKTAEETRPFAASLQFLGARPGQPPGTGRDTVAVSASYGTTNGWLHVGEGIDGGAIGIGAPTPMIDADTGRVVLTGGVDGVTATELAPLLQNTGVRQLNWELRDFGVGQLTFEEVALGPLTVNAQAVGDDVAIEVQGETLQGTAARRANEPWQVDIERLQLPPAQDDADPLPTSLIDHLVAAEVTLQQVIAGEEDYGAWRFAMRPEGDGVALANVVAELRGLRIESRGDDHVFWSPAGTRFHGSATAGNLQTVLPQWGFAESVISEGFTAEGRLHWPGSPVHFDLAHLTGQAALEVTKGSFVEVAPSGTRIMSLINFSTIVKRMSLDFSDVFGRGVAFDRVLAELAVEDGLARFTKPGEIIGTGSSFLVTGTVDLDAGDLNNELIVTVPILTDNLPWYAAFLAFSNPASAAGVWLGRQVFKDQLKRLSSGKYRIGGTYEEPEVEFLSIFDNDINLAPGAATPAATASTAGTTTPAVQPPLEPLPREAAN